MNRVSILLKTQGTATYELFQVSTKESIDEVKRKIGSERIHSQLHLHWQGKFRNSKLFETIQELGYDPAKIEFEKDTDAVVIFKIFPQAVYQAKETKKLFDPNKTVIKDKKGFVVITRKKKVTNRNFWTFEEDALLFSAPVEEVARVLGRNEKSVKMRIYNLKTTNISYYNKLMEKNGTPENKIPVNNIKKQTISMKKTKSFKHFTEADDAVVFACSTSKEAGKLLGRSPIAITNRKSNLKRREPEYFASMEQKYGSLTLIKQGARKFQAIRNINEKLELPENIYKEISKKVERNIEVIEQKSKKNEYTTFNILGVTIKFPAGMKVSIESGNTVVID